LNLLPTLPKPSLAKNKTYRIKRNRRAAKSNEIERDNDYFGRKDDIFKIISPA
jgi:hypothetical protein